jgi:peptidoglycan hydrolase CwlO-like protein
MNIVNAYARISELSNRKLEVQNKLRKELEQIDQMGAKLEEHTSKIREYDPYKADLILDKFNL